MNLSTLKKLDQMIETLQRDTNSLDLIRNITESTSRLLFPELVINPDTTVNKHFENLKNNLSQTRYYINDNIN